MNGRTQHYRPVNMFTCKHVCIGSCFEKKFGKVGYSLWFDLKCSRLMKTFISYWKS